MGHLALSWRKDKGRTSRQNHWFYLHLQIHRAGKFLLRAGNTPTKIQTLLSWQLVPLFSRDPQEGRRGLFRRKSRGLGCAWGPPSTNVCDSAQAPASCPRVYETLKITSKLNNNKGNYPTTVTLVPLLLLFLKFIFVPTKKGFQP